MNKRKKKIRLLLADDHPVVRRGIRSCLSIEHLEIVGEAVDGQEAIAKVAELKPDIVLMDIDMPKMSGLEATRLLRKEFPEVRVLILSVHSNKQYVLQIIQSGAQGYVLKDASPADLVRAIEAIDSGEAFFSPDVSQIVLNQYLSEAGNGEDESASGRLTSREREVLSMIAEGQSNKEMANRLGVGVRTVETHRERVMDKLNIHTVAGLTKYAIANGIAGLE
jgi:two-component system nitrate/nitrite response regulator NarL